MVIVLVVVGIILGLGFMILNEFIDNIDDYSATVTREKIDNPATTATGSYVATVNVSCFNTFVPTALYNESVINYGPAGTNWTYNTNTGTIKNLTNLGIGNKNVTYTYKYGKDSCDAVEDTVTAMGKIPTWLAIIVILGIVGILLSIVFKVLPTGGSGGFGGGRGSGGTMAEV